MRYMKYDLQDQSKFVGASRRAPSPVVALPIPDASLDEVAGLGGGAILGPKDVVARHDHEGQDNLGDEVEDAVRADLEGDGERSEALGEQPHSRVADPHEDAQPSDLSVKLSSLASPGVGSGLVDLSEVHDDREQSNKSDKEPEPLDSGHNRDRSHVQGAQVDQVSSGSTKDDIHSRAGDLAEQDDDEGEADHPVTITSPEELPAPSDGSPALSGKHGKVGGSGESADVGHQVVVLPLLAEALALAKKITVETAKIKKATVRAPTPVDPTCSQLFSSYKHTIANFTTKQLLLQLCATTAFPEIASAPELKEAADKPERAL
eukprot:CAMPEP_0184308310 /NCGR_PEP_ID=MMETSP1049-20130417/16791_1 /TAXON_ID=77928 /ORGANISM="Proteomonas sulcata, Strain CCMP704" /LENGTH=319 /DNA_ID=CAMNT_0026620963 /DNA_START=103 /DNA_END=1064 /DNA_ORIENTATION=-